MRPSHIETILDREFESAADGHHTPVMLWGPPGVGKSQIVAKIALQHGVPLIDIRLSQMEPTDLRGIPFRNGQLVEWSIPSVLPDAERHGPAGILFLDEITSAPPTVSAAAYQLILDRRLGEYQVPEGWVIFAAGNRQGDRGVTYAMPAPLANRFTHYEVEVNLDDWIVWANSVDIDTRVIAFLRFRPDLLFSFDPAHTPIAFPSPRSWEYAHRALQKFDKTELLAGRDMVEGGRHPGFGHGRLDVGGHRAPRRDQRLELGSDPSQGVAHGDDDLALELVSHLQGGRRCRVPGGGDDHHIGFRRPLVVGRANHEGVPFPFFQQLVAHLHGPILRP